MTTDALSQVLWLRRLADFWSLIKARQTALLLFTGLCGYLMGNHSPTWPATLGMAAGLFLAIGGCTALNMLLDRDIDAAMGRTSGRPLPGGRIRPLEAALFGGALSLAGLTFSFGLDWRFGMVVAAGFAFDLFVYTLWLKRRSALSILYGGVAGGMPVLAARVLALGYVDAIGLLLAAAVLLWIPGHILTLATRHAGDFRRAGVPVWPNRYGQRATHLLVATAMLLHVAVLATAALLLRIHPPTLGLLLAGGLAMVTLAVLQLLRPGEGRNWLLFKAASVYMVLSMALLTIGSLV